MNFVSDRIIEPFRIKVVEPIRMTTRQEREEILQRAGFNLFKVDSDAVLIDFLTDSGTGAMSAAQWSGMMRGDESYAGSPSYYRFESAVKNIFGFKHVIPTHQGRAAERILVATIVKAGDLIPNNTHFDTTRANIEAAGATALDLPCKESLETAVAHPFKGNIDLESLASVLKRDADRIPFAMITVTNNGGGGQPVSMANIRAASGLCRSAGIPLYIDACRFAENSYFIRSREEGYSQTPLIDIAREIFSYADGCTMSAKKDGMSNIGGFLCTNDTVVANKQEELLVLTEGFPTYGGLAGRDLEAIAIGLGEALDLRYQEYRASSTSYLGEHLTRMGVPIIQPPGGHAIYVDAKAMLPHIPQSGYPGQALVIELYRSGGIRSVEIGSVMFGTANPETYSDTELVRLAIPRRTYTKSQVDYVVDCFEYINKNREQIQGVRITRQSERLRHFTASFELI